MKARLIPAFAVALLLLFADTEARKTSSGRRSGSSGWGGLTRSRSTPRPRTQYSSGGSTPNKIGWNVPDSSHSKNTGSHTAAKPSAPVPETVAKTSATNVQSGAPGYSPSGGYPRQPAGNPYHSSVPNTNSQPVGSYNGPVGAHPPYGGQPYNPSAGAHPPYGGQPYNPSVGGHPPYTGGYPSPGGHAPYGQPSYNPSYGQPHAPSMHGQPSYNPYSPNIGQTPQTVILQSGQASRPGIGQLAKEAFVFAGVSAGVNAAVNRLLPGGIYGHSGGSSGGSARPGETHHTQITYNNYYNNGTAVAPGTEQAGGVVAPAGAPGAAPAGAAPAAPGQPQAPAPNQPPSQAGAESVQTSQTNTANNNGSPTNDGKTNSQDAAPNNNPNPLGYVTPNDDLKKLTESLFEKDKNNAYKYITVNLQGQKKDDSKTDDASEPLLTVKEEAYEIPTIKAVLALHDNYELDVKTKEEVTSEKRREENEFLDKIFETEVMQMTMKYLAQKGYIPDDEYEFKDTLRRIWFSHFKRIDGDASSSGFESVFLAEQFDSDIIGLHNWIYYAKQEAAKKLNYLGYINQLKLGDKAEILKVRSSLNEIVQPMTTIFVGTSPELEIALYTMCFFISPNNVCPVSMGGKEFMIIANRVSYFGKDILIAAYPDI